MINRVNLRKKIKILDRTQYLAEEQSHQYAHYEIS